MEPKHTNVITYKDGRQFRHEFLNADDALDHALDAIAAEENVMSIECFEGDAKEPVSTLWKDRYH